MNFIPPAKVKGRSASEVSEEEGSRRRLKRSGDLLRCAGGFTFFEILMVLLIISLAGILVYPDLQPALRRTRGKAAARKIAAFLDDVRRQAILTGRPLVLSINGDKDLLVVREKDRDEAIDSMGLPEGAEVVSIDPEEVYYFPQGHSGGTVITLRSGGRRLYRIEVGSFTGLARIGDEE